MLDRRLIVLAGKGGVGRTTVAAALATVLARRGRRVLLMHVRTRQHVARLLGCRGIVSQRIRPIEPNLWAVNSNPAAALREVGLMVLRFKAVYRAVFENRLVKYFLKAIPALNEYSVLGKAWYHTTEVIDGRPKYDTVIFDGPATGHLISMLRIPQVILDVVPRGPLSADARQLRDLLADPERTALWIVTTGEEMPYTEALDLYRAARDDLGIPPQRLVVNGLFPDTLEDDRALSSAFERIRARCEERELTPLLESVAMLRSWSRINRHYLGQLRERMPLPHIELPYLFLPELDRPALNLLGAHIEAAL